MYVYSAMDTLPFDALCQVFEHLSVNDLLAVDELGSVYTEAARSVARRCHHQYTLITTSHQCAEQLRRVCAFLVPWVRMLTIDFQASPFRVVANAKRTKCLFRLVTDAEHVTDLTVINPWPDCDFTGIVFARTVLTEQMYYDFHFYLDAQPWDNGDDINGRDRCKYRKKIVTPAMVYRCLGMPDERTTYDSLAVDLQRLSQLSAMRQLKLRMNLLPNRSSSCQLAQAIEFLRDMAAANGLSTLHWQLNIGRSALDLEWAPMRALHVFSSLRELQLIAAWRLASVRHVLCTMTGLQWFENAACEQGVLNVGAAELRRMRPDMGRLRLSANHEEL